MLGAQSLLYLDVGEGVRPAAGHDPEEWSGHLVAAVPATLPVEAGDVVALRVDAAHLHLFDPDTEHRLGGGEEG
jgi:hypothetical protein